jgi:acyl-CoA thioesterase FadM
VAASSPAEITIRRRIEWMDTDAAGIYHWTTACRLTEAAEAALHTALDLASVTFGVMPRVRVEFDFKRPLRFNDDVAVRLAVEELGRASVRYRVEITGPEGVAVEGALTACLVDWETRASAPWPDAIRARLTEAGRLEGR